MRDHDNYSDEYINAYVDGELDNDDRARILFDEQEDTVLAQRINEVRMLKEKVQLVYADIHDINSVKKPFSCTVFTHGHRSLVAGIIILITITAFLLPVIIKNDELLLARQLINSTQPIAAGKISAAIGTNKQVVINISQYQAQNFDTIIDHIEALLIQNSADELFNIEIIANKSGIKALDTKTSLHAERISLLASRFSNLSIVACAESLANLASDSNPVELMKNILVTPSAALQVSKRINEGWLYLKV